MKTAEHTDLTEAVREIGPVLRANAERSDREAHLAPESLAAMREAGLFRLYEPRALGGLEIDPVTHTLIQEELARHDSAAAWVLQVASSSAWWCSRLPDEGVDEMYAAGADQLMACSFGIPVEAAADGDGLRLSGQRPFASFVSEASWIWLTALTMEDGQPATVEGAPVVTAAFFPASEAKVVPTWDTLGMRATDSNDVAVEDVFVPARRTFRIGLDHVPGHRYDGPLYRIPAMLLVCSIAPAVGLGLAREAIDEVVRLAQEKTPFSSSTLLRDRPSAQARIGRAEGDLRSVRTYLYDRITWAWERTVAGEQLTLEDKGELLLAAVTAVDTCVRVVDAMYATAGASAIYRQSRLEQVFRDMQTLRQHGFVSDSRFETIGQLALGLPPELGFVAL